MKKRFTFFGGMVLLGAISLASCANNPVSGGSSASGGPSSSSSSREAVSNSSSEKTNESSSSSLSSSEKSSESTSEKSSESSSEVHTHTFDNTVWEHDSNCHWHPSACGHDVTSSKEAHSFKEKSVDPSYKAGGYTVYTCRVCGYSYQGDETVKLEHRYSQQWSHDEDSHWHACLDKGYESLKKDVGGHDFEVTVTEASHASGGYTRHICKVCGYSYDDNETLATPITITWLNWDGSSLGTSTVAYGETPSYEGDEPTKEASEEHSYAFDGWSPSLAPAEDETTYTAQFKESVNTYQIVWENDDGTVLRTEEVAYGETPDYGGDPVKEPGESVYYGFEGWDPSITSVSGDATYRATYSEHSSSSEFRVYFNANGGEGAPSSIEKAAGESVAIPDQEPTREGYLFYGWNSIREDGIYSPGDSFKGDFNVTFWAMWLPKCSECGGEGQIAHYTSCSECDGTGWITTYVSGPGYSSVSKSQCSECGGTGRLGTVSYSTCSACGGTSYSLEKGPRVAEVGTRRVALTESEGYEYSKDGVSWQSSGAFEGLNPDTTYSFYQRRATSGSVPFGLESRASSATTRKVSYSITYVLNGGTNDPDNPASYTYESEDIALKDPTREGYYFKGWFSDSRLKNESNAIPSGSHENLTFYAKWEARLYELSVKSEAVRKGLVSVSGTGYAGNQIKVTATPNASYMFKGWFIDGKLVSEANPYTFTMPASDRSVVARFNTTTSETDEAKHRESFSTDPVIDSENGTLTYGLYPQTRVSDEATIASLDALNTIDGNGWWYLDGSYYAKAFASPYNSNDAFDDGTTIVKGTAYWFKCEPIKWKILSSADDGTYSLVSTVLLDAHRYNAYWSGKDSDGYYANNYEQSEIRAWLNGDFFNKAFSLGNSIIQTTEVDNSAATTNSSSNSYACGNTEDKIYLLSNQDYCNTAYFANAAARQCKTTDWARANGAWYSTDSSYLYNGYYWTRSPYSSSDSYYAWYVSYGGGLSYDYVVDSSYAVRPSLRIKVAQ